MQQSIHSIKRVALVGSHIRLMASAEPLLLCTCTDTTSMFALGIIHTTLRMVAAPRSEWSLSLPRLIRY